MAKSISDNRKKRGRPATGTAPLIGVRMTKELQDVIRSWAQQQQDRPALAPAIRRLVELGLAHARPSSRHNPTSRAKARQLAAVTIAGLTDPSAAPEEQAKRKRRLTK